MHIQALVITSISQTTYRNIAYSLGLVETTSLLKLILFSAALQWVSSGWCGVTKAFHEYNDLVSWCRPENTAVKWVKKIVS